MLLSSPTLSHNSHPRNPIYTYKKDKINDLSIQLDSPTYKDIFLMKQDNMQYRIANRNKNFRFDSKRRGKMEFTLLMNLIGE